MVHCLIFIPLLVSKVPPSFVSPPVFSELLEVMLSTGSLHVVWRCGRVV